LQRRHARRYDWRSAKETFMSSPQAPLPPRKRSLDRIGIFVIVVCGALALSILAWAASLPDGIVD
jgi:hypothetical protein